MKVSKQATKIAKMIIRNSLVKDEVDKRKVEHFLKLLRKDSTRLRGGILISLEKQLTRQEKNKELLVETPFPITSEQGKEISKAFEKLLSKNLILVVRENKDLISGVRITNADTRWENTLSNSLSALKGGFN